MKCPTCFGEGEVENVEEQQPNKLLEFAELVARMKTEEEFGEDQPESEDWICTLNELIETARKLTGATADMDDDDGPACSADDCDATEDIQSTYCGSFCEHHLSEHCDDCEVCAKEFRG